jgi:hypothetical protein
MSLMMLLVMAVLFPTQTVGYTTPPAVADKLVLMRRTPVPVPARAVTPRIGTVPVRTITAEKMGLLVLCLAGEASLRLRSR